MIVVQELLFHLVLFSHPVHSRKLNLVASTNLPISKLQFATFATRYPATTGYLRIVFSDHRRDETWGVKLSEQQEALQRITYPGSLERGADDGGLWVIYEHSWVGVIYEHSWVGWVYRIPMGL